MSSLLQGGGRGFESLSAHRSSQLKREGEAALARLLVEVGAGEHAGSDATFGELLEL
jgi:hypothetical protein